ncbi:MAG: DnaJ domain-containing protein [Alphaproteobacteria bacterium]|nr:DnaJ domain-containing protein [Alphaproteobacteria bacterium]
MVALILGGLCLAAVLAALGMFSKANVKTLKTLGIWVVAIGGMLLAAMLLFSGRGMTAIWALVMLGPLVWSWVVEQRGKAGGSAPVSGPMTRAEAYEILGLKPGADAAAIRAAHRRLMQAAHPDHGGSDWLAARINQARDVLLG